LPAVIAIVLALATKQVYVSLFLGIFVGSLMASRLPTISLKHLKFSRKKMPLVLSGLLFLIAMLVSNFWLTLGIMGFGYILTVPISCILFVRSRKRYETHVS
jgi:phosphatidylserine synthase